MSVNVKHKPKKGAKHYGLKVGMRFIVNVEHWRKSKFEVVSLEPDNYIRAKDLNAPGLAPMTIYPFQMELYIRDGLIERVPN